jgi:hypothetical protein
MWRRAKVSAGNGPSEQAFVDFADWTPASPVVLEWPAPLPLNTEITIGEETRFAGDAQACAGQFHVPLMRERRLSLRLRNLKQYQPRPEAPAEPAAAPTPPVEASPDERMPE